jgi:hypothetical protein
MSTTYVERAPARRQTTFGDLVGRVWPLFFFSLPGVIALAVGLAVGYNYTIFQLPNPDIVWEGHAALSVGLIITGMLSFYAGLILYAILSLRSALRV